VRRVDVAASADSTSGGGSMPVISDVIQHNAVARVGRAALAVIVLVQVAQVLTQIVIEMPAAAGIVRIGAGARTWQCARAGTETKYPSRCAIGLFTPNRYA